jgi:hypothetical protein
MTLFVAGLLVIGSLCVAEAVSTSLCETLAKTSVEFVDIDAQRNDQVNSNPDLVTASTCATGPEHADTVYVDTVSTTSLQWNVVPVQTDRGVAPCQVTEAS